MAMTIELNQDLQKAARRLQAGDVVGLPTETVYGLAASIQSEVGLRRIFEIKQRPFFDPLIVHVAAIEEARTLVREWPPVAEHLARAFWPGPLTLVLPKSDRVNPLITSGLETVGLRCPRHPLARRLIEVTGAPLAAPSANRFGRTSPSRAEHVRAEFGDEVFVIDGGPCEIGLESTVVGVLPDKNRDIISIYRPGAVTETDLRSALADFDHPIEIRHELSVAAPGHLKHHYMPAVPLVILPAEGSIEAAEVRQAIAKQLELNPAQPRELQLNARPELAARALYDQMRVLAEGGADLLWVRRHPEKSEGFWLAIWDRLTRAASADLS